ncbi:DNA repair protein XRCC2 isoform X1 [Arctopsyche grandis]|uniref:DNA repair protein XRCC2 isoform X1 n=1 Tax=Arctopsyche grandis TaxID=121162 RepID=UPI00406D74BB
MDIRQSEVNHNFILNLSCPVESGAQAFTRLVKPPSLIPLHQKLLPQAPKPSEVIEISYDKDTPHNALISDFISNAILPIELGGKNAEVVILHTDGQFNLETLIHCMKRKIKAVDPKYLCDVFIKRFIRNLHIVSIYDSQQMYVAIHALENVLAMNVNVSLVIIDSIVAFYWSDRMFGSGILKVTTYVLKILQMIKSVTKDHQTVIMYTKPNNTISKQAHISNIEENVDKSNLKINHKLCLRLSDEENGCFSLCVNSYGTINTHKLVFENYEIYLE